MWKPAQSSRASEPHSCAASGSRREDVRGGERGVVEQPDAQIGPPRLEEAGDEPEVVVVQPDRRARCGVGAEVCGEGGVDGLVVRPVVRGTPDQLRMGHQRRPQRLLAGTVEVTGPPLGRQGQQRQRQPRRGRRPRGLPAVPDERGRPERVRAARPVAEDRGQRRQDPVRTGRPAPAPVRPPDRRPVVADHHRRGAPHPPQALQRVEDRVGAVQRGPVHQRRVRDPVQERGFGVAHDHAVRAEAEQRQVVEGVAGHQQTGERPLELVGQEPHRLALPGVRRQYVEVAPGGIRPGAAQPLHRPGQLRGQLAGGQEERTPAVLHDAVLVDEAGKAAQRRPDAVGPGPAGPQFRFERVDVRHPGTVEDAGADIRDDPARYGQQRVPRQPGPHRRRAAAGREDHGDLRMPVQGPPQPPPRRLAAAEQRPVQIGDQHPHAPARRLRRHGAAGFGAARCGIVSSAGGRPAALRPAVSCPGTVLPAVLRLGVVLPGVIHSGVVRRPIGQASSPAAGEMPYRAVRGAPGPDRRTGRPAPRPRPVAAVVPPLLAACRTRRS